MKNLILSLVVLGLVLVSCSDNDRANPAGIIASWNPQVSSSSEEGQSSSSQDGVLSSSSSVIVTYYGGNIWNSTFPETNRMSVYNPIIEKQNGGSWYAFSDIIEGGLSTSYLNIITDSMIINLDFEVKVGVQYPFAGVGFYLNENKTQQPIDTIAFRSVCITYQSSTKLELEIESEVAGLISGHVAVLPASIDIITKTFMWSDFALPGWDTKIDFGEQLNTLIGFSIVKRSTSISGNAQIYGIGFNETCTVK